MPEQKLSRLAITLLLIGYGSLIFSGETIAASKSTVQPSPFATQCGGSVSIFGSLKKGGKPNEWILTRADGKRFWFTLPNDPGFPRQKAGNQVHITGNFDGVKGTEEHPVIVLESITPVEAYQAPETPKLPEVKGVDPKKQQELALFFPNLGNLVTDPKFMLGPPVVRKLPEKNPFSKAVELLLKGPSNEEKQKGFFNDDDLRRLKLDQVKRGLGGKVTVTLEAPWDFQFSNSGVPERLDRQIQQTLHQFDEVKSVKVIVRGPKNSVLWTTPES